MIIFYICCGISFLVFATLIYALINFSRDPKQQLVSTSLSVEIFWMIIPFVLLILMAIPATRVLWQLYHSDSAKIVSSNSHES